MNVRTMVLGIALALQGAALAQPAKRQPRPRATNKVDLSPVIAAVHGTEVEAAAKAVEQLGASTDPAAHEALLDALAFGMPRSVVVPALNALALHPAPVDVVALARYAKHRHPSVRSAALVALGGHADPIAKRTLIAGLRDLTGSVRASAAGAIAKARLREAVEPLLALMALGEEPAARALAAMADPDLARVLGDRLGKLPDPLLAQTLGWILKRTDFGPDPARVDVVAAIAKIQDAAAITALTDYLDATPKTPPRPSRVDAQRVVDARGGR